MDRLPLHRQLADVLRSGIEEGLYQAGQPLPSEPELAVRYGVSRQTVRQALGTLAAEHRIRRIQGKGTFVCAAQDQAPQRETVGFVAAHLGGSFLLQVLVGVERALARTNVLLAVRSSQEAAGGEVRAIDELLAAGVRGLIVEPSPFCGTDPAFFHRLVRSGVPLVFVDRCLPGVEAACVSSDNLAGGLQLMRHLLQQGHRRFAFLLPEEPIVSTVAERLAGVRRALAEAGLPPTALIERAAAQTAERHSLPPVRAVLEDLLAQPADQRPTALLCSHDDIALQALRALHDMGRSVPGDLALTGFDDLPYAAWSQPALTTVRQDARAIGEHAARLVLRGLERAPAPLQARLFLPVELRLRASTLGDGARPETPGVDPVEAPGCGAG
jgi:GntR family transcriptional regulator of arabinose operon